MLLACHAGRIRWAGRREGDSKRGQALESKKCEKSIACEYREIEKRAYKNYIGGVVDGTSHKVPRELRYLPYVTTLLIYVGDSVVQ